MGRRLQFISSLLVGHLTISSNLSSEVYVTDRSCISLSLGMSNSFSQRHIALRTEGVAIGLTVEPKISSKGGIVKPSKFCVVLCPLA